MIPYVAYTQNWELLVFYPWRQRHFGDVKLKHEKQRNKVERAHFKRQIKSMTLATLKIYNYITLSKLHQNCFRLESEKASFFNAAPPLFFKGQKCFAII